MSISSKKKEAEAALDSARMILDTFGGSSTSSRKLESKVSELEAQIESPDSERRLDSLIEEVRTLMDELEDSGGDAMMEGPDMAPSTGRSEDDMHPM